MEGEHVLHITVLTLFHIFRGDWRESEIKQCRFVM